MSELAEETSISLSDQEIKTMETLAIETTKTNILIFLKADSINLERLRYFEENSETESIQACFSAEEIDLVFPLYQKHALNFSQAKARNKERVLEYKKARVISSKESQQVIHLK